jgi:hypothetical protein
MARLVREHDWAATPLGPVATWPASLKGAVGLMLAVPQAMWIGWGPEFIQIYNDGYRALLDDERHGAALGRPTPETWADNWSIAGPMLTGIFEGGPAVSQADRREVYRHNGEVRELYYSYSFSPIPDETTPQGIGGVLCVAVETTPAVLLRAGQERDRFLLRLSDALRPLADPGEIQAAATRLLGQHLGANQVHYGEIHADSGDEAKVVIHQGYGDGLPPMVGTFHHRAEGWGERLLATYRAGWTAVSHNVDDDPSISAEEASYPAHLDGRRDRARGGDRRENLGSRGASPGRRQVAGERGALPRHRRDRA